jgi:hypothetical protein
MHYFVDSTLAWDPLISISSKRGMLPGFRVRTTKENHSAAADSMARYGGMGGCRGLFLTRPLALQRRHLLDPRLESPKRD